MTRRVPREFWFELAGGRSLIDALWFSFFVSGSRMRERGVVAFAHDAAKSGHQFRPGRAQFIVMVKREFGKNLFAFRSEREQNLAAIVLGAGAVDKASRFQAVHKFHGAMVADLHAIGQFANPRTHPGWHALDRQHE